MHVVYIYLHALPCIQSIKAKCNNFFLKGLLFSLLHGCEGCSPGTALPFRMAVWCLSEAASVHH